ncbi:BrnT family toxin [Methylorubrum sp. SB2]|uniref:BrnT family toxin n=1 Tax=Methylorubrum subtropicum TaxID=3138812 RepID=UPI00313E5B8A
MQIVWDEPKRETNLAKHGLDFAAFADGFDFDGAVVVAASPSAFGSTRIKLLGEFEGRLIVAAVVAPLGSEALSLVSLRPASRKERRIYEDA